MGQIVSINYATIGSKSAEQQKVIKNFFLAQGGCMNSSMTKEEYLDLVRSKYKSLDIKNKALNKLGIDESEVQEVPPVEFVGFNYSGDYYAKDNCSSKYETTWIFFSDTQIYAYSFVFDMTSDSKNERTEEYFYKDVTSFSSSSEDIEISVTVNNGCTGNQVVKGNINNSCFSIVVPGDKFVCSMEKTDRTEAIIQGMKQKLREKKNA